MTTQITVTLLQMTSDPLFTRMFKKRGIIFISPFLQLDEKPCIYKRTLMGGTLNMTFFFFEDWPFSVSSLFSSGLKK